MSGHAQAGEVEGAWTPVAAQEIAAAVAQVAYVVVGFGRRVVGGGLLEMGETVVRALVDGDRPLGDGRLETVDEWAGGPQGDAQEAQAQQVGHGRDALQCQGSRVGGGRGVGVAGSGGGGRSAVGHSDRRAGG